ncbi:hypothetical protein PybrP1_004197 [[Pythium] brassicae (nom. inval.)]|nr:hypothetical protein PybrP1_004197 [[Pythium] brassicae (nom. inval.)]
MANRSRVTSDFSTGFSTPAHHRSLAALLTRHIAPMRVLWTAALALCAVTMTSAAPAPISSLKLAFHVKRSSMLVHGYSDFDVFVNPIVSAGNSDGTRTVSFEGTTTFVQDGVRHTYVLVDGVPYHTVETPTGESTTSCIPTGQFPPVHTVLDAIADATSVSNVDTTQEITCPHGQFLKATFAGEDFVLCTASGAGGAFKAFGEDVEVEFQYLQQPVMISTPARAPTNCAKIAEGGAVPLQEASVGLLWGTPHSTFSRSLRQAAQSVSLANSSCACKGTPKPCIFFHGMDVKEDGGLVDDSTFFGDIKKHAPCCSSFKFALMNTVDHAWTDDALQQKTCEYALSMSPKSSPATRTIEDTIIVAHSMGNLQLAGAVATGKCFLGETAQWVDLSGPLKGSMGSDLIRMVCDGGDVGKDILKTLGGLIGQCPGTATRKSLVYDGGNYCNATQTAQYAAARSVHSKHVTASICGRSFAGLSSGEAVGLFFGGALIPHKSSENDGVVEFQSCIADLPAPLFKEDYASPFYRAKLNHADTTMHNGDALFDKAQKPVKWFECLL